jgi:hypothetical protein
VHDHVERIKQDCLCLRAMMLAEVEGDAPIAVYHHQLTI